MKKMLVLGIAVAVVGPSALATDLNVSVQYVVDHSNKADVGPWETVHYEVVGVLTDDLNEGLALFGFDLDYTCGDMTPATAPTALLENCETPGGITNPAGFGGTLDVPGHVGKLIQVGCGQNTIKNTENYADFPLGSVITGVGHTEVVLATGSVVAPDVGPCEVILTNLFANIIREGETGEVFYATDAAGVGSITNLTINVGPPLCGLESSDPPNCAIDARQPSDPDGSNPAGWDEVVVTMSGTDCVSGPGDFVVSEVGGTGGVPIIMDVVQVNANTYRLVLDGVIEPNAWACFAFGPDETCIGSLPANANSDTTSNGSDIDALIAHLNAPSLEMWQCDIDRSEFCGPVDLLRAVDLLNGADAYDVWDGELIPVCPSP